MDASLGLPRLIDEGESAPITLHCSCGANFSCRSSTYCPGGCPWSRRCGYPSSPGAASGLSSLQAVCPSCRMSRSYESGGYPVDF